MISVRHQARVIPEAQNSTPSGYMNHLLLSNPQMEAVPLSASQIIEPQPADTVVVLVSNASEDILNFTYYVKSDTTNVSSIGPNPIRVMDGTQNAWFFNVPEKGHIYIYSINGRLVRALERTDDRDVRWDLKDRNGYLLSGGVYFYVIEAPDTRAVGKFAVIR